MNDLVSQVDALTDSDLIEAAGYYLSDMTGVQSVEEIEEQLFEYCREPGADLAQLQAIRNELSADRASYTALLRFLLREAAQGSDEQRQRLSEAIAGVGQKQVVLEVALVVALGTLATMQLIHHTKGKEKENVEVKIEVKPDGTTSMSLKKETVYASSSTSLGHFFAWLKTLPWTRT